MKAAAARATILVLAIASRAWAAEPLTPEAAFQRGADLMENW